MTIDSAYRANLDALLLLLRKHRVYKFKAEGIEVELDRGEAPSIDETADPGVQLAQLEAFAAKKREEIEKIALVDDFGAS